jgi:hypothetical protein
MKTIMIAKIQAKTLAAETLDFFREALSRGTISWISSHDELSG